MRESTNGNWLTETKIVSCVEKVLGIAQEDVICDGDDKAAQELDEPIRTEHDAVLLCKGEELVPSNRQRGERWFIFRERGAGDEEDAVRRSSFVVVVVVVGRAGGGVDEDEGFGTCSVAVRDAIWNKSLPSSADVGLSETIRFERKAYKAKDRSIRRGVGRKGV